MHKILIGFILAALTAAPALSAEKGDVMKALHQFTDAFNKGDMKAALAACADATAVIDDFPPHVWSGAGACAKWSGDFDAFNKANEIIAGTVTLGKPRHIDITADRAYVVVPTSYTYTMKGKAVLERGAIITVALQKSASGWRLTAWDWSQGRLSEVKAESGK